MPQPRGERGQGRLAPLPAPLVHREAREPALRDLLAAVHRDLRQPVLERGVGEAGQQRVGIGLEVLTFRQRYYRLIYGAAEASLAAGGPVQGTNFWAWNGEARAQHPDHRFHEGDTQYMGDPPHEPQGWYGNFDSDAEMLAIVREHAKVFATA